MESPEAPEMSGGYSDPSVTSVLEGREVLRAGWIAKLTSSGKLWV